MKLKLHCKTHDGKQEDWIYDNANSCYKVEFTRNYSLNAQFRVYDTAGNEGRAYDIHTISIN